MNVPMAKTTRIDLHRLGAIVTHVLVAAVTPPKPGSPGGAAGTQVIPRAHLAGTVRILAVITTDLGDFFFADTLSCLDLGSILLGKLTNFPPGITNREPTHHHGKPSPIAHLHIHPFTNYSVLLLTTQRI